MRQSAAATFALLCSLVAPLARAQLMPTESGTRYLDRGGLGAPCASGQACVWRSGNAFNFHTTLNTDINLTVPASTLTTKGDLLGFGASLGRLGVGSDGQFLQADSTQTLGLKWAPAGVPGNFVWFDLAKTATAVGNACTAAREPYYAAFAAANRQTGVKVLFLAAATATGLTWYNGGTATETATCNLWSAQANTPVLVTSGTVGITGTGEYTCTFASPATVNLKKSYYFMIYQPSGYSAFTSCTGDIGLPDAPAASAAPFHGGPNIMYSGSSGLSAASAAGTGAAGTPSVASGLGPSTVTPNFTVP